MPRLATQLGGGRLFVKRDDCTGLALGGNKARQLEFYFGRAQAAGADTVMITGAVQSNYVRMTAAAAAKLGMASIVQLEERVAGMGEDYHTSGNVLLDHLFGADIRHYPDGEDEEGADASLADIAAEVKRNGGTPFIIPLGPNHPPRGALGYVVAAGELLDQAREMGIAMDVAVIPSGSGHTHAGLLFGLRMLGSSARVAGICVRRDKVVQRQRILNLTREIAVLLGRPPLVGDDDVWLVDDHLAPGYGRPGPTTLEAIKLAARCEGLLVDPVYSGKALAGLIGLIKGGDLLPESNVVFVHTGGMPAAFAYRDLLAPLL